MPLARIKKNAFLNAYGLPLILWLQFAVLIAIQARIYFNYNLAIIDSDQFFMWAGLKDYASGVFYEPRYYAQNYNTFFEALVAVPFYKMGLSPEQALPLATHLLFLFPIASTAIILYKNRHGWQAAMFLAFILSLNPSYFLLVAQPRGFVTGLFFCSFLLVSVYKPHHMMWLCLNTVLAVLAYFVNPNSFLFSVPVLVFLFNKNYNNKSYYFVTAFSLLSFFAFDFLFNSFYRQHPDYIKTGLSLGFSVTYFIENINHLDAVFAQLSPFREGQSIFLILFFFYLLLLLLRQRRTAFAIATLAFLLVVLLSFFLDKTRDGSTWAYLSYSRMFLAVPFVLAFMLSGTLVRKTEIPAMFVLAILLFVGIEWNKMPAHLQRHFDEKNWNALSLIKTKDALNGISVYAKKCKEKHADFFLISHSFWMYTALAYGGKAVQADFPDNMENYWDKRYWVREKYENMVLPDFMFLSSDFAIAEKLRGKGNYEVEDVDGYGLVMIHNNTMKIKDFAAIEHNMK